MAKSAPELIATLLGWDMSEVKDAVYQGYSSPSIYVCGDTYYCCPTHRQKLPKEDGREWNWYEVGNIDNRAIFEHRP